MPTALDIAVSLWLALLSVVPRPPASMRPCLARGAESIPRAAAEAAAAYDVPVGVLLVVAWLESHAGCDRASGGCWGAPVDARHRLTAGRASHAASALSLGFRGGARSHGCGTWLGAVSHFRCGLCRCPPPPGGVAAAARRRLLRRVRDRPRRVRLPRRGRGPAGAAPPCAAGPAVASRGPVSGRGVKMGVENRLPCP